MAVKQQYREIVRRGTMAAGAVGVPGAFSFGLDVTAMSGIWVTMLVAISGESNHRINKIFATKLVTGVLTGVAAYIAGSKLAMKLLHLIPGAGSLAAMGLNSFLNAIFTYKFGHAMSNLFDRGSYDEGDVAAAVSTVLTLIACVPTIDETSDFFSILRGA